MIKLADNFESAVGEIVETASATEELSSSVNKISRQVQESARIKPVAVAGWNGQRRCDCDITTRLSAAGWL